MNRSVLLLSLVALLLAACGPSGPSASLESLGDEDIEGGQDGSGAPNGDLDEGDGNCTPVCLDKVCGDDGCGGSCGACGAGLSCLDGSCLMGCDSVDCALGKTCWFQDGTAALCGGTLTFNVTLDGKGLFPNVSVESLFQAAGVLFSTPASNAVVATNDWSLKSASGGNSCASLDSYGQPWREPVVIRFVKPLAEGTFQAATHYVSLYVGDSWPGGIAVEFYGPNTVPGSPGASALHAILTDANGTDFIEYGSGDPIGFVVIHAADDPDFTVDDLTFGPLYVP